MRKAACGYLKQINPSQEECRQTTWLLVRVDAEQQLAGRVSETGAKD
jgi:hypothetical protein